MRYSWIHHFIIMSFRSDIIQEWSLQLAEAPRCLPLPCCTRFPVWPRVLWSEQHWGEDKDPEGHWPPKRASKIKSGFWACSATWEAEAGESLEPRSLRPAWEAQWTPVLRMEGECFLKSRLWGYVLSRGRISLFWKNILGITQRNTRIKQN